MVHGSHPCATVIKAFELKGVPFKRVELPAYAVGQGHGIEHRAGALDQRGRAVLAASMATRPGWFDRVILNRVARLAVPEVARRGLSTGPFRVVHLTG